MRVGVIKGRDPGIYTVNDMLLERLQEACEVVEITDPFSVPHPLPQSFLLRSRGKDFMKLALLLETLGVRPVNSHSSFLLSANKHLAHLAWDGLQQPSWALQDETRRFWGEPWSGPTILKPVSGAGGRGIEIFDDLEEAPLRSGTLLQPYIEGNLWRVIYSDRQGLVSAYRKETREAVASVARGAVRRYDDPPQEIIRLAGEMVASLAIGISGLDIIEGDGFWALESNANFDFSPEDEAVFEALERELLM